MHDLNKILADLESQNKFDEAIQLLKNELKKSPRDLLIQTEIGNYYAMAGDFEEALGYFRRVYHIFRDNNHLAESISFCLNELGNDAFLKRNYQQSKLYFEELINHENNNWRHFYNYANVLQANNEIIAAISHYLTAQSKGGRDDEDLYNNLANAYLKLGNLIEAKKCYEKSYQLKKNDNALLQLLHLNQKINDWSEFDILMRDIHNRLKEDDFSFPPFPMLSLPGISNEQYLSIANQWNKKLSFNTVMNTRKTKINKEKVKVAYMSSDLRNHPLFYLVHDTLSFHNEEKFEVIYLFNGAEEESNEYLSFKKLSHNFINTFNMSDHELIQRIIGLEIDILIDLSGFTKNSRTNILKYHSAPIQINWLGYPGTFGSFNNIPLCDYIFADELVIDKMSSKFFSEQIINLKPTYQPNNFKRPVIKTSRASYQLPDDHFIFASFNQNLKITKNIFDTWLNILKECPESSLWILIQNDISKRNIKEYATNNGLDDYRIIIADYVSIEEHMGRIEHVDLFLDCYPYNAHTTIADAIYSNKPTITHIGEAMQSRVGASLLYAIDCFDELVFDNLQDYKKQAIFYYNNRQDLKDLNVKIKNNKNILFKPDVYIKNIEEIYLKLISKQREKLQG
jgi:protein O-GlcNAc transferase